MKKILSLILTVAILCGVCMGFWGCEESYKTFETEYFKCREYKDRITIPELTELGKEQEILIVPAKLREKPVTLLGEISYALIGSMAFSRWGSDKLEKLFLMGSSGGSFKEHILPNLQEIYVIGVAKEHGASSEILNDNWNVYVPNIYDIIFQGINSKYFTANVSYFYNYADCPNNGYYWIDNYSYGGQITFIPPPPERERYTFGGWYKETACINAWDFDADRLPISLLDGEGKEVYQELKLYAKWIKK